MSTSKRTALEDAMAAWRDSTEIGLTVARQVRKAESGFGRVFKSVARSFKSKKQTDGPPATKIAFADSGPKFSRVSSNRFSPKTSNRFSPKTSKAKAREKTAV